MRLAWQLHHVERGLIHVLMHGSETLQHIPEQLNALANFRLLSEGLLMTLEAALLLRIVAAGNGANRNEAADELAGMIVPLRDISTAMQSGCFTSSAVAGTATVPLNAPTSSTSAQTWTSSELPFALLVYLLTDASLIHPNTLAPFLVRNTLDLQRYVRKV